MIRSPPKCSFFTLAFYPNFVLYTIIRIFFFSFVIFVLVLRRTHGPSISTQTHMHTVHMHVYQLPLCSCYVRTLCVKLTQVVYYIIVRVFQVGDRKTNTEPEPLFCIVNVNVNVYACALHASTFDCMCIAVEKTEQAHVRLYACERAQQSMKSMVWCLHGVCLLNVKARAKRAREKKCEECKYPLGAYKIYG